MSTDAIPTTRSGFSLTAAAISSFVIMGPAGPHHALAITCETPCSRKVPSASACETAGLSSAKVFQCVGQRRSESNIGSSKYALLGSCIQASIISGIGST